METNFFWLMRVLRSVGPESGDACAAAAKGKGDLGAMVATVGEVIVGTERMSLGRVDRSILIECVYERVFSVWAVGWLDFVWVDRR